MAVLPPTEESTWARSVVGTCARLTPRLRMPAAKPVRSPITPPPSATISELRARFIARSVSISRCRCSKLFTCSPAGRTIGSGVEARLFETRGKRGVVQFGTFSSVTTGTRPLPCGHSNSPLLRAEALRRCGCDRSARRARRAPTWSWRAVLRFARLERGDDALHHFAVRTGAAFDRDVGLGVDGIALAQHAVPSLRAGRRS